MPSRCRVALMFDPDQLDLRQRAIVRGVAAYAAAAGRWAWAFDPFALDRAADAYDGILAPAGRKVTAARQRVAAQLVTITWGLPKLRVARVLENRYFAGQLAARHLVERGYRSFAYLGFTKQSQSYTERLAFRRELALLGRDMAAARTFVTYARRPAWHDKTMATACRWLDRLEAPVGMFVCRPGLARLLADRVLAKGLRIPADVGLVAADDDPVLCEPSPALTSIHFDYREVGRRAAELLDRLMDPHRFLEVSHDLVDGRRIPKRAILIPPTLVPRLSTDREATADPLVARALYWIDDRRTEPICPRDVAAAMGLGRRALGERFRRAGRGTIVQEITRARVAHAKILLAEHGATLGGVARLSGFGTVRSLRRAFHQHADTTPSAWRRQALLRRRGADDAEERQKSVNIHFGRGRW